VGRRLPLERFAERGLADAERAVDQLRPLARPLATDADLDPLLARVGGSRYVLIGEASRGTAEFYTWRERLTRRLIAERGFSFVAVEGDWPDCYRVNRYARSLPGSGASAEEVVAAFDRWPTCDVNQPRGRGLRRVAARAQRGARRGARVGFYGLDVYSPRDSMRAVTRDLNGVDPEGNYVPTVLPRRYDALLFVDETRALSPLHPVERADGDAPETWPTGM
jgi:erythromycin esterase-like protein